VAFNSDDLLDGGLQHAIDQNELDNAVAAGTLVWTGSIPDGSPSGFDCTNWSTTLGSATVGDPTQSGSNATQFATDLCSKTHSFYCLQKP